MYGERTLFYRPCARVMTVLRVANMNWNRYVDHYLGIEAYTQTYLPKFHSLLHERPVELVD